MVEKITKKPLSEYAIRLAQAMSLEGQNITPVQLAEELGVFRQAVEKFFRGESTEMKAGNHVKTARFLGVDSAWLALGEGVPRPGDFPVRFHERQLLERLRQLPDGEQDEFAEWLNERHKLRLRHAGAPTADPFHGAKPGMKTKKAAK